MYKVNKFFINNIVLLFFIFLSVGFIFGQNDIGTKMSDEDASIKAQAIIKRAVNVINKNSKIKEIDGILLELQALRVVAPGKRHEWQTNVQLNLFINFPNQIRLEENIDYSSNQQFVTEILNSPLYSVTSDISANGKPINVNPNVNSTALKLSKEQRINLLYQKAFNKILPIILITPWYHDLELKYVGAAESKDFKAEVIEAVDKNKNKSRLFFDKQTYLPLMMVEHFTIPNTSKEIERKTYYSDFKSINGLLVAHKLTIQTGSEMTEEFDLKKLQINPVFKSNLFQLKEDKINPYGN